MPRSEDMGFCFAHTCICSDKMESSYQRDIGSIRREEYPALNGGISLHMYEYLPSANRFQASHISTMRALHYMLSPSLTNSLRT
jgi:hypothetical protein